MITVKFQRITPTAQAPSYATEGAIGADLWADEDVPVRPGVLTKVHTGIAVELPPGHEGQIRTRSSAFARGLDIAFGTVDTDYRGELIIMCRATKGEIHIKRGQRIAQLVIKRCDHATFEEVERLDATPRGSGGFGSTGRYELLRATFSEDDQ